MTFPQRGCRRYRNLRPINYHALIRPGSPRTWTSVPVIPFEERTDRLAPVKDASCRLRRWPAAILVWHCARRSRKVTPGRRNGPFQPNRETGVVGWERSLLPTSKLRAGVFWDLDPRPGYSDTALPGDHRAGLAQLVRQRIVMNSLQEQADAVPNGQRAADNPLRRCIQHCTFRVHLRPSASICVEPFFSCARQFLCPSASSRSHRSAPRSAAAQAARFPGATWDQLPPAQSGWSPPLLDRAQADAQRLGSTAVVVVQLW